MTLLGFFWNLFRRRELKFILSLLFIFSPFLSFSRTFVWSVSNGNINITNANVGFTLKGGDSVLIPFKAGGYRSFSMSNIGMIGDSLDIQILWQGGAYITPGSGIFGNTMDSCNHVRVYAMNMSNHGDPVMFTYANLGHSHFITWDSCIFKNMPGMFPSSTPSYASLPKLDTTNQYDTVNTFYKWRWHNCRFDSTLFHGLTALTWNGAVSNPNLNQVWMFPEVDSCFFNNYSSNGGPSTYINATAVFGAKIHDNIFQNLGVGPVYNGHAASIFSKFSNIYVYRNIFVDSCFGDDVREIGMGEIKQFRWLMSREIPGYNGRSWFCFNFSKHQKKYSMAEIGVNPSDSTLRWYIPRASMMVFNNTMWRPGMGLQYDPYTNPIADLYGGSWDSIFVKNNVKIGPNLDTTAWNFTVTGSAGPAVSGLIMAFTNGPVGYRDTSNNLIDSTWPSNGYVDSTGFSPVINGILYNKGTATGIPVSPGITTRDLNNNAFPQNRPAGNGIDIGATEAVAPPSNTPWIHHSRKFKTKQI